MELKFTDMLIMSYGGIRGAIAFALALILDESKIPHKKEFVTATIAVVFFTVFVQVATDCFITHWLRFFKLCFQGHNDRTISKVSQNKEERRRRTNNERQTYESYD